MNQRADDDEEPVMPYIEETQPLARTYARSVRTRCPECDGDLTVLRVIAGRAGCEYWAMRCTACGGIHLDILEPRAASEDEDGPLPAA
jgi:hypothetical protein